MEIYRMGWIMEGEEGVVIKAPPGYGVTPDSVCVHFDRSNIRKQLYRSEVAIIEPVTPHGSTQAIVSANTPAAPAPSELSNGHKEAEMTNEQEDNANFMKAVGDAWNTQGMDADGQPLVLCLECNTHVTPERHFEPLDNGLYREGGTWSTVCPNCGEEFPATPATPDSGRLPSRFAPAAGNTWRDHLNDEPALNVTIDDLMTDEQPSAPADDHKLPDDWEPSDELYIYQISWINKHGLEPIPPELDAMFKELCEVDDANEKLRAERDAALADAKALREKYNETAQRAIVLRESLELVLDRRNGHIVGTKHLHEADILQLEKALRAASADAGAKGENG